MLCMYANAFHKKFCRQDKYTYCQREWGREGGWGGWRECVGIINIYIHTSWQRDQVWSIQEPYASPPVAEEKEEGEEGEKKEDFSRG
jgi:hypothetical protein